MNIFFWLYYIINYTDVFNEKRENKISQIKKVDKNFLDINIYSDEQDRTVLIKTPSNKIIAIDLYGDNIKKVLNFFKKNNILIVDKFFLNNIKENYIDTFLNILNNIVIVEVVDTILESENKKEHINFLNFIKKHPQILRKKITNTYELYIEPYFKIKIFYAFDNNENKNIGKAVILLEYKNINILLTSENNYKEQYFLMKNKDFVNEISENKITVFEYPNLSFENNIFDDFINLIAPKIIIINPKSLFNGEIIDMNIWKNVENYEMKKITNNFLNIRTDGKNIEFFD
ncbi:MAG: hypothetical protein LBF97_00300 [Elusimicrobiota bacterium]|nr:hypothetical protein [Elusimicrobiota bacterium]